MYSDIFTIYIVTYNKIPYYYSQNQYINAQCAVCKKNKTRKKNCHVPITNTMLNLWSQNDHIPHIIFMDNKARQVTLSVLLTVSNLADNSKCVI